MGGSRPTPRLLAMAKARWWSSLNILCHELPAELEQLLLLPLAEFHQLSQLAFTVLQLGLAVHAFLLGSFSGLLACCDRGLRPRSRALHQLELSFQFVALGLVLVALGLKLVAFLREALLLRVELALVVSESLVLLPHKSLLEYLLVQGRHLFLPLLQHGVDVVYVLLVRRLPGLDRRLAQIEFGSLGIQHFLKLRQPGSLPAEVRRRLLRLHLALLNIGFSPSDDPLVIVDNAFLLLERAFTPEKRLFPLPKFSRVSIGGVRHRLDRIQGALGLTDHAIPDLLGLRQGLGGFLVRVHIPLPGAPDVVVKGPPGLHQGPPILGQGSFLSQ